MPDAKSAYLKGNEQRVIEICMRANPDDGTARLEGLQEEAHKQVVGLRSKLLDLLNTEYAGFIGLSSNLVGTSESIHKIRAQSSTFQQRMEAVQGHVAEVLSEFTDKMVEGETNHHKQRMLQLLNEVHTIVDLLFSLLENKAEQEHKINANSANPIMNAYLMALEEEEKEEEEEEGEGSAELTALVSESILIERVSRYMEKLLILIEEGKAFAVVRSVLPKVQALQAKLDQRLAKAFISAIKHGQGQSSSASVPPPSSPSSPLARLLRSYLFLGKCNEAEDRVRLEIVRPIAVQEFNKEKIREVSLSNTCDLASMYNRVQKAISSDLGGLLLCTQTLFPHHFSFMTRSVWRELESALSKLGTLLFAPGIPDLFHTHYVASMRFLSALEELSADPSTFATYQSTVAFKKRWNVPVYFQLRLQQAVDHLEGGLGKGVAMAKASEHVADGGFVAEGQRSPRFHLQSSRALWTSLEFCWLESVWLDELTDRLFGLTLKLLARFTTWVEDGVSTSSTMSSNRRGKGAGGAGGSSSGGGGGDWKLSSLPLSQAMLLFADLKLIANAVLKGVLKLVIQRCDPPQESTQMLRKLLESGLSPAVHRLSQSCPMILESIEGVIVRKALPALASVGRIKAAYRMTGKQAPTTASDYVPTILKYLEDNVAKHEENKRVIGLESAGKLTISVCHKVCERYLEAVGQLLDIVDKTEKSLKRLHANRAGAKSTSGDSGKMSDSDKIRLQLKLDLTKFLEVLCGLEQAAQCDLGATKASVAKQVGNIGM